MNDLHSKPGHLIRRAHQISSALFAEECDGFDLTSVQYAALVAIRTHPGLDATRLSGLIAFDRSKLLRDVANSLSEQHVNIVACSTHTGSDRVAKMRFEFELGDPSHLEAILSGLRRIDSVYDAYRVLPGGGN